MPRPCLLCAGEPLPAPQAARRALGRSSPVVPSGMFLRPAVRGAATGTLQRQTRRSRVPLHVLQSAAGNSNLRFYSSQGWDPWDPDGDGGPWGSLDAQADLPVDQQPLAQPSSSRSARRVDPVAPPRNAQSWSSYMGDDDGDSPWASLDAIADGAEHLAVPFTPSQSSGPPSTQSRPDPRSSLQSEPRVVHNTASSPSRPPAAVRQPSARPAHSSVSPATRLTHVDPASGEASMVDVSAKSATSRAATASARVYIPASVVPLIRASSGSSAHVPNAPETWRNKGPVLHTAQLAGIMAAKRTADLIPLCHPLALSHVEVHLEVVEPASTDLSGLPGQSADGGFGLDALGADEAWDEPSSSPEERAWIAKQLAEIDGRPEAASAEPEADAAGEAYINVRCTARTSGPTGVEMEALTGASVACLTLWDMLKSVGGRTMRIDGLCVTAKSGGKSGDWTREDDE